MLKLTDLGRQEVDTFLRELDTKRKEILDAGKDTADATLLPKEDDILMDIEFFEEDGEYCNGWGCTDNYNGDSPLYLEARCSLYRRMMFVDSFRKSTDILTGTVFMPSLFFVHTRYLHEGFPPLWHNFVQTV